MRFFDRSGRRAAVRSGTPGWGKAIAVELVRANGGAAAASRRAAEVDRTAAEIESLGRKALRAAAHKFAPTRGK